MPAHETAGAQTRQVWMFMVATAMATTVSTMVATAMVKADSTEPAAVTCACEAPAAVPVFAPPPVQAEVPVQAELLEQAEAPEPSANPLPRKTTVKQAKAGLEGAYDRDLIRRIVRAHIDEVRYCYNEGLAEDPELAGTVTVDFVIGSEGKVTRSEASSEMKGEVPDCIADAVSRWLFPRPENGQDVAITYPFVLEPG